MTRKTFRAGKTFITASTIAIALVGFSAPRASAQSVCPGANAGPFCIDGIITDANNSGIAGSAKVVDPNGSSKELGPINGSGTKIGVINTSPVPVLGLTNPNAQVDLNTIYTHTAVDPNTGHIWYYFGWARDSNSGSGFISIELQKSGVPAECTGTSGYSNAACNPWKGRQTGDFIILWDQQGNSTQISLRFFNAATPGFGPKQDLNAATSRAAYSSDNFRGEAAIDFTELIFPKTGECTSFANTLPGTVTGNSDTADYKDAVLGAFPPVTNCGVVTVQKVTSPAGLSGSFPYTLTATGGIFSGPADSDCADPNSTTQCHATLTTDGDLDTITNLLAKTSYTLTEDAVAHFAKVSISCVLGGTTYNVYPGGSNFPVVAGSTTACTISNRQLQGSLKVIKHVINDNGGTAVAGDFLIGLGDSANTTFAGSETGVTRTFDEGYIFSVGENSVPGYSLQSITGACTGAIVADTTQVCTITNNDQPGHLIVIKHVINDNGGTAVAGDFTMTVTNGASPAPFAGHEAPGTNVTVNAGSFSVTESSLAGYTQGTTVGCSGNISLGETKTCTITNTDNPPTLIVIKHVINDNGGTAVAGDFTMTVTNGANPAPFAGQESPGTSVTVNAGGFSVAESSVTGYSQTGAVGCSGTIALGETKTCTITNQDAKAAPGGTTGQSAVLHDSFTIATGIRAGGGATSVTFSLYLDAACSVPAKSDGTAVETRDFTFDAPGTGGTAKTTTGVGPVSASGTYYWKASWTGNAFNQSFETSCGKAADEKTTVTFQGS